MKMISKIKMIILLDNNKLLKDQLFNLAQILNNLNNKVN